MALVFRTSSIANAGPTTIKNSALSYEEGDGNFAYLLTNMSGSNINITGDTLLTGQLQLDGNVFLPQITSASQNNILTYNTSSGRIYYTSSNNFAAASDLNSYVTTASFTAFTSSYNTGSFSGSFIGELIGTSSWAVSASWAPSTATPTGSLLTTASVSNNTITFTKGDASQFSITVATGSGGSVTPGGSDTQIQFNSGSTFSGSAAFRFVYTSQSLEQGNDAKAVGQYSHAEGFDTNTGAALAWSASILLQYVTMSAVHGNVSSNFNIGDRLYIYRTSGIVGQIDATRIVTESVYNVSTGNTILGLSTSVGGTRREAYIGNVNLDPNSWTGGGSFVIPGIYAHSEGLSTNAIGQASHAEGNLSTAYGLYSHAEGFDTKALGAWSHAEGIGAQAVGAYSHAEGFNTIASAASSHAAGWGTSANGFYQSVIGQYNISSSAQSAFIIGNGIDDSNRSNLLFAEGNKFQISGSLFISGAAQSSGNNNVLTYNTTTGLVTYTSSAAIGGGGSGTPGGSDTQIQFNQGGVFGATGSFRFIYASQSLEQGNSVQAIGIYSHAEGDQTIASGYASHAEGGYTLASASYSHAEGEGAVAFLDSAHAEGYYTSASGVSSHAEGKYTQALGEGSHAEGLQTIASGDHSHAEGESTIATGRASHASGYSTIASASYQTVVGIHNATSSIESAFIVGNGAPEGGENGRRNLLFVGGTSVIVTGSFSVSGSATLPNILTLPYQHPLPNLLPTGSIALSGSGATFVGMFVFTGAWTQI